MVICSCVGTFVCLFFVGLSVCLLDCVFVCVANGACVGLCVSSFARPLFGWWCVCVCLFGCSSVCLCVCAFVCLFVCRVVCS